MIQNNSVRGILCVLFCFLFFSVQAQFSGSNLMEFQYGKIPTEVNDAFPSIYNRTILNYRFKKFTASTTIENYYTKFSDRNYTDLSQLSLRYKHKKWDIKLGNFYETLGRGTLLRAFEIKGALLEDIGFRSRNYFHRDILGASVKYKTKKYTIHLMHGDVLDNLLPPTKSLSERRTNRYTSVSGDFKYYKKHRAKLILLSFKRDEQDAEYFMANSLKGPLVGSMNYFIEYSLGITNTSQSAFYGGVTGLVGALSYSLEYRSYRNIILGSGINEPPPVIKMQTYRMLNRSIHVSNPDNEDGYQFDLFYSFENGSVLNLNHSRAHNEFGSFSPVFKQFFLEWSSSIGENNSYKLYLDYSIDDLKSEPNRLSLGLYNDFKLSDKLRFLPEFEIQQIERVLGNNTSDILNQFYSLGFSYASKLNFNLELEVTSDPFLLEEESSTRTMYPGMNVRYKFHRNHAAQMFLGKRRGGPACSAGVCYEILDFRGFEFRLSSRF